MDEIMEMRRQLAALRESLEKTEIVNNKLIRRIISQKVSSLNRIVKWECIAAPLLLLLLLAQCKAAGGNVWVVWTLFIGGSISLLIDFKTIRISPKTLSTSSLLQIKETVIAKKRQRKIQNVIELPLALLWSVWYFIEIFHPFSESGIVRTVLLSMIGVLLAVTAAVVIWVLNRIDRTSDSIVSEISGQEEGID